MFLRKIQSSLQRLKSIRPVVTARRNNTQRKGYVPYGQTGCGNYGLTFSPQTVQLMNPVKDKLLKLVPGIPFNEHVFNIGDYGTGDGATSMTFLKELLDILKERHGSERQFQVIYEDQSLNDFNSLFRRLSGVIPDPPPYLLNMDNVFAFATGVHFYKQCVPSDSMHYIMCMIAAHWLSKTPVLYKESLCIYPDSSAEEKKALRDQSLSDWETFLLMRSRELKRGGILAVSLTCEYVDETIGRISFTLQNLVFLMTHLWREYRDTGKITNKEFINTNIAYCHYNMEDLKAPFENNTSAVWQSGLRLVSSDVVINNDVFYSAWKEKKDLEGVDDRDGFVRAYVAAHRNWSNSIFMDGLSDDRSREDKLKIVDDFYVDMQERIASMNPDAFRDDFCLNYLIIVKE
ncbi:farnesoic acid carboxyl-O-methyltransferase-like [Haliotis rubra]|uniref:farnesoic acid carboxyl-O-methyltransferase-like n=1 Tax=Haliotis rubra TaxID=36100 RepID=UPI001EE504CE|nr:farnesoic acid carboxyl-O-methyltransferase-like [Haliotis rubra]